MDDDSGLMGSYGRMVSSRRFWERFSELFLGRNEAVRRHFDNVPPAHRRELLQRSLGTLFQHAKHEPGAEQSLDALAQPSRGGRQDIPETLYGLWLASLLQAVRECDPHYSMDLEEAWRRAMENEVAHLLQRSRELAGDGALQTMTAGASCSIIKPIRPATPD
jgi:hypothetical protein